MKRGPTILMPLIVCGAGIMTSEPGELFDYITLKKGTGLGNSSELNSDPLWTWSQGGLLQGLF